MNKLIIALAFVLPAAPALAQAQLPRLAAPAPIPMPATPPPQSGSPGLYLQVMDGAIIVTNAGGSHAFAPGQFGLVPNMNQPPIVVPNNPGIQFTPPPMFNSGGGPAGPTGPTGSNSVDCVVR